MRPLRPYSDLNTLSHSAVFIDFDNLYEELNSHIHQDAYPQELIHEMISELRRYLREEHRALMQHTTAFGAFNSQGSNSAYVQQALADAGIKPVYISTTHQDNAPELELCMAVCATMHERTDIHHFVILTGNRYYLPLITHALRRGKSIQVMGIDLRVEEITTFTEEHVFLDATRLLGTNSRSLIQPASTSERSSGMESTTRTDRSDTTYTRIEEAIVMSTLEIIEEYFGQYEEVYLTPLLRKLTELIEPEHHDPKLIINDLERAGAVWLEKRRGFPYDYTVLLVDAEHPDVIDIQQRFAEEGVSYDDDVFFEQSLPDNQPEDDYPTLPPLQPHSNPVRT